MSDGPLARAVVEVDQDEVLPGAERQASVEDRHGLRWADHGGALMRVRVAVVVEPVVLVVAGGRDQSLEHRPQVGDAAGLELHRRDRRRRAADECERLSRLDAGLLDESPDRVGDVADVGIPPSGEAQFGCVNRHRSDPIPTGPRSGPRRMLSLGQIGLWEDAAVMGRCGR